MQRALSRWQRGLADGLDRLTLVVLAYPPKVVPLTMLGFPCRGIWNYRRNHEEATIQ